MRAPRVCTACSRSDHLRMARHNASTAPVVNPADELFWKRRQAERDDEMRRVTAAAGSMNDRKRMFEAPFPAAARVRRAQDGVEHEKPDPFPITAASRSTPRGSSLDWLANCEQVSCQDHAPDFRV